MLNVEKIRKDFPILKRKINGYPLAYLDNAATSQKPKMVIEALENYYENINANVHRGVHTLSEEATEAYEMARKKVKGFLNAGGDYEVIFTKNTTEAINLVSWSWGWANLKKGDRVLLTIMEHHSNIVPWLILVKELGIDLAFGGLTKDGLVDKDDFREKLLSKPRLIAVTHVSNVLGTINPVKELTETAHQAGAQVLIDAAQSVPHLPINVNALKPDFLVFSAHKMLGPTGVGVLIARKELMDQMEPVFGGGGTISEVTLEGVSWAHSPHKFEAGTPNVAGVIATGAAIDYLVNIGMENIREHEKELTKYTLERLGKIEKLGVLGTLNAEKRSGVVAFTLEGVHPHDLTEVVDSFGVAIRGGHHCAQPLHNYLKLNSSARASFYLYNTKEEVDRLVMGIEKAKETFRI